MGALLIDGNSYEVPGITVVSKIDQKVFPRYKMGNPAKEIVLHESVSATLSRTEQVLAYKKLGVHLAIDYDGTVYQYCDLRKEWSMHGGWHSYRSIGIEVINSYYADRLPAGSTKDVIQNQGWVHKKDYVVPTKAQLEASYIIIRYLTLDIKNPLYAIPLKWPAHKDGRFHMSRLAEAKYTKNKRTHKEGIFAHNYWAHADGSFIAAYAFLRIEGNFDAEKSYNELIKRCNNISRRDLSIDVSDISVGQAKSNSLAQVLKRQNPNIIFDFA
jgi:hypothetical protein